VGCIADVSSILTVSKFKVVGIGEVEVFSNVGTAVHVHTISASKNRINDYD
jgi:hypothetical protein